MALGDRSLVIGIPGAEAGATTDAGIVSAFVSTEPIVVNPAYCAHRGGVLSGSCLAQAIAEANAFGAAREIYVTPGRYEGCPDLVDITVDDLLITTTAFPNLAPAAT